MKQDKTHQVFNNDDYKEDVAIGGVRVYFSSFLISNQFSLQAIISK